VPTIPAKADVVGAGRIAAAEADDWEEASTASPVIDEGPPVAAS
jgi:hypothetical protein